MTNQYSEKVSVNMNTSTLANIDILVDNGYYSNRSDFINQAVREGLQKHQSTLDRLIDQNKEKKGYWWFLGVSSLGNSELLKAKEQGLAVTYAGYGVLVLDKDIDTELLFSVIQKMKFKGKIICDQAVKDHYGLK